MFKLINIRCSQRPYFSWLLAITVFGQCQSPIPRNFLKFNSSIFRKRKHQINWKTHKINLWKNPDIFSLDFPGFRIFLPLIDQARLCQDTSKLMERGTRYSRIDRVKSCAQPAARTRNAYFHDFPGIRTDFPYFIPT